MKDKLYRAFQLLNMVTISGQQNIMALGESINIITMLIQDIEQKEREEQQNKPIEIDNTKEKKEGK